MAIYNFKEVEKERLEMEDKVRHWKEMEADYISKTFFVDKKELMYYKTTVELIEASVECLLEIKKLQDEIINLNKENATKKNVRRKTK